MYIPRTNCTAEYRRIEEAQRPEQVLPGSSSRGFERGFLVEHHQPVLDLAPGNARIDVACPVEPSGGVAHRGSQAGSGTEVIGSGQQQADVLDRHRRSRLTTCRRIASGNTSSAIGS